MTKRKLQKQYHDLVDQIKKLTAKENPSEEEQKLIEQRWAEAKTAKKNLTILESLEEEQKKADPIVPKKEKRNFSLLRVVEFLSGAKRDGYENEVISEIERRGVKATEGLPIPYEELFPRPPLEKRIIDRPEVDPELITKPVRADLLLRPLYERGIMGRIGARQISANGPFRFPKGSAVSAGWFTGSGGSAASDKISEQDPSWTEQEMSPKYLGAFTSWSLRSIKESAATVNLESLLRESISEGLMDKLEESIWNGTDANQPKNFFTLLGANVNNTAKTVSNSVKWQWQDFTKMVREWKIAYKHNSGGMPLWVMRAEDEELLKNEQRFTGTDGRSIADSLMSYLTSSHLPSDKLILGDFSQFLLVNFFTAEISLGLSSDQFLRGSTSLRIISYHDQTILRPEAFRQFTVTRS